MKLKLVLRLAIAGLVFSHSAAPANTHSGKVVDGILVDSRPCVFFWLTGVDVADSVVPGSAFALAKTHPNYSELNAMLLTAKAGGRKVTVTTTGVSACGYAAVEQIAVN